MTHDLGVVAHYCDRVIVMYAGKIVEQGPVRSVFLNPAHPYTDMLLKAVPREGQELAVIRGRIPDLIDYPRGCPFYERCDHRSDPRCETEMPPLREVAPEHWAATFCQLPDRDLQDHR